jgi:superfamily II DNA or RNA helicase
VTPPHDGIDRRVVAPFDRIDLQPRGAVGRVVAPRLWRRACRAAVVDAPAAGLRAARTAAIDLLPHQLEPALAILRGLATRVLLADEVGLGKTIQAALVASELIARGAIERVIVLTPAGLRDQWVDELAHRFALDALRADARVVRQRVASLPIGVNPWQTMRIVVASLDYVKRADVLPAVAALPWDLVVIDEAHGVVGDSDRHAAAHALASRASYALLLTATPHNGDRDQFARLSALGSVDDSPLAVFRRSRSDVGIATRRRVHVLKIAPTPAERRLRTLLTRYAAAVRTERARNGAADATLALAVLHKRLLSSAWSLAQSVERRLDALSADAADAAEQLPLPLDDGAGELTDADRPPEWPAGLRLGDAGHERQLLASIAAAARHASNTESKLRRLNALLRRTSEPAIVFTEYRDTLARVRREIARPTFVLHGGLDREERAAVLRAFTATPRAVLLATDAAAEGLNLHQRCRLVVNLELPWTPSRLEQRIGRVDRIGQRRIVHAFHLVCAAGETTVLERLRARLATATADLAAASRLDDAAHEHALANEIVNGGSLCGSPDSESAIDGDR